MGSLRLSGVFLVVSIVLAPLLTPGSGSAQTACDLVASNYFRTLSSASGEITFVSRPVIRCRDGTRIEADSAEIFSARSYSQFFGNVEFQDSATVLTTDRAHFFSREGRLQAWGSVVLTDREEGSRITGDTLVYLRPVEARPTQQITVTGRRPHATLYPALVQAADSAAADEAEAAPEDTAAAQDPAGEDVRRLPDLRRRLQPREDTVTADTAIADTVAADTVAIDTVPADSAEVEVELLPEEADEEAPGEGVAPPAAPSEPEDTVRIPYEVDADRIFLEGERYFRATGSVEVRRDSLEAYGDSVEYDQRGGRLFITESARLLAASYVLLGRVITLVLPGDEISEIVSQDNAELTGEDLRLTAPEIRVYLVDGRTERLVAVHREPEPDSTSTAAVGGRGVPPDSVTGPPRPRAVATRFVLVADSIEAQTPDEILKRVVASGRARGESLSRDSLNTPDTPEIARRDWLEGDTVVAEFEPDTTAVQDDDERRNYRLDRVTATGSARSLYRMEPSDTTRTEERMALHYVQGRTISIWMEGGEVREMEVQGQTRGMYLEPVRRTPPDATPARGRDSSGENGDRR